MSTTLGSLMEVARIQSEINRLFDNLLDLDRGAGSATAWMPNVDISESQESRVLKAELPGGAPESLSLSVLGGNVIVRGAKQPPTGNERTTLLKSERVFGEFRRAIPLGVPVNTRQARAELTDGLLRIRFPKVPNRRGEEVPIEVQVR